MNVTEITSARQTDGRRIRLAAYCRVSSDSEDQLHSFAAQIRYYKDYERRYPEYELIDVYADEGITGTSMDKRDEFLRLIRDCKRGKIDRIITKSVARFARNTKELLTTIRLLKDIEVSVYFEEQDIDTDKLNSEMIVTFPGMAAQQESMAISGNMRWSYKKRMESGDFNCCRPAYGFNLTDGKLVVNETEAEVVRRVFDLYLSGCGKQAIANIFNEEKIPRRYGQEYWNAFSIDYMLNNERYIGDALLQKNYTTDTLPFEKRRNNGERNKYYVENANPAIVSKEIYHAAKELQKSRKKDRPSERQRHLLNGVLRCADCGRTFRRLVVNEKAYWLCSGRASGTKQCTSVRVSEADFYEAFTCMADKLKDHGKELLGELIHDIEIMQSKASMAHGRIKEIDREIADLAAQNLVLSRLHTNGILCAADYTAQSADISSKISELRTERRKRLNEDATDEQLYKLKQLRDIMEEYEPQCGFDETLFEMIVESVKVKSRTELIFSLHGGLALTEKLIAKGRWKTA